MWKTKDEEPNIKGKRENLCWTCENNCGGCSWSGLFKPVPGWDAEADVLTLAGRHDRHTFKIRNCPEYIEMGC